MLKLPKGLKKKKKKSKKDQELFTEEELEEYKRQLEAKQEAAAAKSDAGESDAASDVEGLAPTATTSHTASTSEFANNSTATTTQQQQSSGSTGQNESSANDSKNNEGEEDEWAKFKALTSKVDTVVHKTKDDLDHIKKESFYQRLPSAAEKKKQEEEELAKREAERLEEEKRKAAELEAQRDKLAEAVVELSESEGEDEADVDDIFVTEYVDAITSGEIQLAVVPDSPVLDFDDGPDPFDTAYAEKVIVGADKAKDSSKKLVSLGAAVEVLSGRVEREKALELAKPKRKLRKGIKNLLLSESVDAADPDEDLIAPEPQINLLDELADDVPLDAPIDLSVSLHLSFLPPKKQASEEEEAEEESGLPDLSEFDTLKDPEDDEFAELAAESLNKKKEVTVIKEIPLPKAEVLTDLTSADWAEFEQLPEEEDTGKPKRPPPPARPAAGPHLVPGAIYVSDDEDENQDDDPFNTSYAEVVIKKTTVLEEDDDFDPRAEEKAGPPGRPPPPAVVKLLPEHTDFEAEDFDPFDTTVASVIIQESKTTLKESLSDPDFDPRADEEPKPAPAKPPVPPPPTLQTNSEVDFDTARRKSSLSLTLKNNKAVGFLVPNPDLLGAAEGAANNKKPLTPYYAPTEASFAEKDSEDPFDTSYVPESKPTQVELKHIEDDLLSKPTLKHSISDPDFDPRAPPTPVPAEELLSVKEDIAIKVLTPAQESKDLPDDLANEYIDPFDTSIASNLQPGETELKLLESEFLPERKSEITTGVLDTQSDAQELGLGDKVLTPQLPHRQIVAAAEVDPFDTSIAENLQPGATEIKLLENELIEH